MADLELWIKLPISVTDAAEIAIGLDQLWPGARIHAKQDGDGPFCRITLPRKRKPVQS